MLELSDLPCWSHWEPSADSVGLLASAENRMVKLLLKEQQKGIIFQTHLTCLFFLALSPRLPWSHASEAKVAWGRSGTTWKHESTNFRLVCFLWPKGNNYSRIPFTSVIKIPISCWVYKNSFAKKTSATFRTSPSDLRCFIFQLSCQGQEAWLISTMPLEDTVCSCLFSRSWQIGTLHQPPKCQKIRKGNMTWHH